MKYSMLLMPVLLASCATTAIDQRSVVDLCADIVMYKDGRGDAALKEVLRRGKNCQEDEAEVMSLVGQRTTTQQERIKELDAADAATARRENQAQMENVPVTQYTASQLPN